MKRAFQLWTVAYEIWPMVGTYHHNPHCPFERICFQLDAHYKGQNGSGRPDYMEIPPCMVMLPDSGRPAYATVPLCMVRRKPTMLPRFPRLPSAFFLRIEFGTSFFARFQSSFRLPSEKYLYIKESSTAQMTVSRKQGGDLMRPSLCEKDLWESSVSYMLRSPQFHYFLYVNWTLHSHWIPQLLSFIVLPLDLKPIPVQYTWFVWLPDAWLLLHCIRWTTPTHAQFC